MKTSLLLLALYAMPVSAYTQADTTGFRPSLHELELERHQGHPPFSLHTLAPVSPSPLVTRIVYGYLPYWTSSGYSPRWEALTTLAWFAVEMNTDGTIGNTHGWGNAESCALVDNAHKGGVRVELVATLFSSSGIHTLLSSEANRSRAVDNLVQQVGKCNADGVNIDFEGLDYGDKADMVTFVSELKAALAQYRFDATVTLATPAVDWSGAWDYDLLARESDGLMIMGYDYHWKNGPPGPVAPYEPGPWGGKSLTWTVDDYIQYGGEDNKDKFILGLPWYGHDWPTVDDTVPGTSRGSASSVLYRNAIVLAERHQRRWDQDSKTPYYVYFESGDGYHQAFYDDAESLGYKYGLARDYDLAGIGIWALGYEGSGPELWDLILDMFGRQAETGPEGSEPEQAVEAVIEREQDLDSADAGGYETVQEAFEAEMQPDADPVAAEAEQEFLELDLQDAAPGQEPEDRLEQCETDECRCKPCDKGCGCSAGPDSKRSQSIFLLFFLLYVAVKKNSSRGRP